MGKRRSAAYFLMRLSKILQRQDSRLEAARLRLAFQDFAVAMLARDLRLILARQGLSRLLRDGAIVALVLLSTLMAAVASLPAAGASGQPFALIFPPWLSRDEAIARSLAAGHVVLRSGASPFIVVAAPATAGAATPARPEGAWLILALTGLAGCLDEGSSGRRPS